MFEAEREAMVKHQLEERGIVDRRVLDVMRKVERHLFVNEDDRAYAYEDRPIPIGSGQTISQPFMVALMTQTLSLAGDERVLEIGTGSGYQTVILAELAREVFTIERIARLQVHAKKCLIPLKYTNIYFKTGDGTLGWPSRAPFDRILVTAAAPRVPQKLFEQLEVAGRLVVPVGGRLSQELNLILKKATGQMQMMHRGGCVFVPLVGKDGWERD